LEELEGHVTLLQSQGMAAALAAAEGQARAANGSVARKDALVRALKERVELLTVGLQPAGRKDSGALSALVGEGRDGSNALGLG
jgi:hypothetical protein